MVRGDARGGAQNKGGRAHTTTTTWLTCRLCVPALAWKVTVASVLGGLRDAHDLIVRFGLVNVWHRPIGVLSTGELRKVTLAKAMAGRHVGSHTEEVEGKEKRKKKIIFFLNSEYEA